MSDRIERPDPILGLTAEIVSAFISNNPLQAAELSEVIEAVQASLRQITLPPMRPPVEAQKPAVPPKKSILPEYLICLEDGKRFKSLKRHLKTHYDLSPEDYRAKWGLSSDYPMVAPAYARERSQLAKVMGLGQQRRRPRG